MIELVLGFSNRELLDRGAQWTAREINQQPILWKKIYALALEKKDSISTFLNNLIKLSNIDIIFTGAGTSAFIGNSVKGIFQKNINVKTRAIATTDIVTNPEYYFQRDNPTLLISFARSGDSPESIAAVNLGNQLCNNIHHLIITCNADGTLAKSVNSDKSLILVLPPETNDQSLAMTGSFTSMLLMAILISKIETIESLYEDVDLLQKYGQKIINDYADKLEKICELSFERSFFLGSGSLLGSAEESHLKLQELTDGHVISKFDSFLGFRHGPKAVINPKTLMVYFFAAEQYCLRYEIDLLRAINNGENGLFSIGLMEHDIPEVGVKLKIILSDNNKNMDPDFMPVCYTLVGQILGFYKSLQLGLKPDSPSKSGTITRVVEGVKIYPFSNNSLSE